LIFDANISEHEGLRKITLAVLGIVVVLGLAMDGFGAIVAMGSKIATIAKLTAPVVGG